MNSNHAKYYDQAKGIFIKPNKMKSLNITKSKKMTNSSNNKELCL